MMSSRTQALVLLFHSLVHRVGFLLRLVPLVDTGWLPIEISGTCCLAHNLQDRESFLEVVSSVIIFFSQKPLENFLPRLIALN